jgi:hypothetical protein
MCNCRGDIKERFKSNLHQLTIRMNYSTVVISATKSQTLAITSPTSLKSEHLPRFDFARKSSINLVPML